MKYSILFPFVILLLIHPQHANTQTITDWTSIDASSRSKIEHDKEYYYLTSADEERNFSIYKYSFDQKLVSTIPTNSGKYGKDLRSVKVISLSNRLFAYFSVADKKTKTHRLLMGEIKDDVLMGVREISSYFYKRKSSFIFFRSDCEGQDYIKSEDESHIAFVLEALPAPSLRSPKKISLVVVSKETMDVVWKKEVEFPVTDPMMSISSVKLSNNGEITILAKVMPPKAWGRIEWLGDNKLFLITKDGGIKELDIKLPTGKKHGLATMTFQKDSNKPLVGGVFFDKGANRGSIKGLYYGVVDWESKTVDLKTHEFSKDVLGQIGNGRGEGLGTDFKATDFITHENGDLSLVLEYQNVHTGESGGSRFVSDEIIVSRINGEGGVTHTEVIKKGFFSSKEEEQSYNLAQHKNKLYFVFNNRKTLIEAAKPRGKGDDEGMNSTDICVIGEDGKIEKREVLFHRKDAKRILCPVPGFQQGNKLFILGVTLVGREREWAAILLE